MEEASVMMTGLSVERVRQGLAIRPRSRAVTSAACAWWPTQHAQCVGQGVRILHSYTDYVKRVVWRDYN